MDFFNKAFAQLSDLMKSMTPGARLTAGLLLVVIVVSLGYLFKSQTSGPDSFLMGGDPISAAQLPGMEAAFSKAGLSQYEIVGNRIRVPRGTQAAYMGALADDGALPPDFGKYMEKATAGGPFQTRAQQTEAIKVAKQSELRLIIQRMKGIQDAAVLYDVQEKRGFGQESVTTASVSVQPVGAQPLDEERVPMLRHLVSSAIAGLKPENVTITDLNGRHYPGSSAAGSMGGSAGNQYGEWKKRYEGDWENKIRGALAFVPGVVISANVELDTETGHEENSVDYDPKTVVASARETAGNKNLRGGGAGGRPGFVSQQGGVNSPATISNPGGGPETSEDNSHSEITNAVSNKQKRVTQHGLTPKRVTVSIGIPSSYYERVWLERNPASEGQPAKKADANALADIESKVKIDVENAVVNLIPHESATVDKYPRVKVTTFQHITAAPLPAAKLQDQATAWLGQYWSTLGMIGLGAFSLLMLRSMVRSNPTPAPTPSAQSSPALSLVAEDEPPEQTSQQPVGRSRLKRAGASGPSLRDELADMVREDPDTAVSILRTWIGGAA